MTGSLLDRFVADDRAASPAARLREGLRRDLEALLNSRRRPLSWPPELDELDRSLVNYGLDDIVHENLDADAFRDRFVADVERLLHRLEPRVRRVEVTVLPNADALDRTLRLRISGVVAVGGAREELVFDSHLDPTRSYLVMHG